MTKNSTTLLLIVFLFTSLTGLCNTLPPVNTDSLIQEYCKANKLTPAQSPSGLYYVIKKSGNGNPFCNSIFNKCIRYEKNGYSLDPGIHQYW